MLLNHILIDKIVLTIIPVVLGNVIPLFEYGAIALKIEQRNLKIFRETFFRYR